MAVRRKDAFLAQNFLLHKLPNGLTVVAEKMTGVRSAAMILLLPAGGAVDPAGRTGTATVLSDLVLRGAGSRNSKQLTDHLDLLGLQRGSSASVTHTRFSAAALADRVFDGMPVYADIVRRAHLPHEGFESSRDLALQNLESIDDEPRQKMMVQLRACHWPHPFGRNTQGEKADLQALTLDEVKAFYAARFTPDDAVISVAGDIDFGRVKDAIESHFGDWSPTQAPRPKPTPSEKRYAYQHQESEQTHIGLACKCVDEAHPDYYPARLAIEALSGGMSGRLFTEIREKKALVYAVSGSYASLPGVAALFGYAGTTNERAQQTLDAYFVELKRLAEGITQAELDRAKTGLMASTIMSEESTSARASAMAHDWVIRGRLRTLDEIVAALESVTLARVNDYLAANPFTDATVVIVGPKELTVPR
jgi:predicted Zn-dependent peptidase